MGNIREEKRHAEDELLFPTWHVHCSWNSKGHNVCDIKEPKFHCAPDLIGAR